MPPNEPATPGTDRLFETGCFMCGTARGLWSTGGMSYCGGCRKPFTTDGKGGGLLDGEKLRREYDRRKSAPTPSFVPAVGEMCDGESRNGRVCRGQFLGTYDYDATLAMLEDADAPNNPWLVTRSSLKPAPAPVEMWGTCPPDDELPGELPAGTKFRYADGQPGTFVAHTVVRLAGSQYCGTFRHTDPAVAESIGALSSPTARVHANGVLWAEVPRPSQKPVPAQACPGRVGSKPCELPAHHAAPCMVEQKAVPAPDELVQRCVQCGRAHGNGALCPFCADSGKPLGPEPGQSPPDPYAGYDLNAWGIAAVKRPVTTCSEPGCNCPYCRHRAFSPKLGANDARYNGGKGPAHSTLDASIAAARHSTEREAGVKRFDAWVSCRHERKAP